MHIRQQAVEFKRSHKWFMEVALYANESPSQCVVLLWHPHLIFLVMQRSYGMTPSITNENFFLNYGISKNTYCAYTYYRIARHSNAIHYFSTFVEKHSYIANTVVFF